MKKIIINADDFGYSINTNEAVKIGIKQGIVSSASILTNMEGFNDAVKILKDIPNLDLGFHFNIMEGKSLTNPPLLTDKNGFFNQSWIEIMLKSLSSEFLKQIEIEFKAQIEKILQYKQISHLDSHVHTHAIPPIFKLFVKLADEYKIKYIRTQHEIPYKIHNQLISKNFCINSLKNIILNFYTFINKKQNPYIRTTDYCIGILYTGEMSEYTILNGLKKIKNENFSAEIILHPSLISNLPKKQLSSIHSNSKQDYLILKKYREFETTLNINLEKELKQLEYLLTSFTNLD